LFWNTPNTKQDVVVLCKAEVLIVKFMVTKFLGRHLSIGWKRGQILLLRLVYIKG
jgi:hypothetical protein